MIPFAIPAMSDIAPIRRLSDTERKAQVEVILEACRGNYGAFAVWNATHALGYSVAAIGSVYLMARADEAREAGRVG